LAHHGTGSFRPHVNHRTCILVVRLREIENAGRSSMTAPGFKTVSLD
jgi:hypothetical protein